MRDWVGAVRPSRRTLRVLLGAAKNDNVSPPADASPGYTARIALDRATMTTEAGRVDLEPGMAVTAEIKTGRRRVISYLLSPFARYRHDALTER